MYFTKIVQVCKNIAHLRDTKDYTLKDYKFLKVIFNNLGVRQDVWKIMVYIFLYSAPYKFICNDIIELVVLCDIVIGKNINFVYLMHIVFCTRRLIR